MPKASKLPHNESKLKYPTMFQLPTEQEVIKGIIARGKFLKKNNPIVKIKELTRREDQLNWGR